MVDVTRKDLYLDFPLMTKAGTPWRCKGGYRVKWEDIEKSGTIIKTNFGEFFFKERIKVDKVYYWILSDGTKKYTIKRDQARKNKKMPKNAVIENIVEVAKTTTKPKEMLLLMPPKELIDILLDKAIYLVKEHDKVTKKKKDKFEWIWDREEEESEENIEWNGEEVIFSNKVIYIKSAFKKIRPKELKNVYRELVNYYHPDKSKRNTEREFDLIQEEF